VVTAVGTKVQRFMDLAFVTLLSSLFPNNLLSLLAKVYLFHDFSRVRVLLILIVFGIFIAEVPVLLYSITCHASLILLNYVSLVYAHISFSILGSGVNNFTFVIG